ncbi:hypothetical protein [Pseudomonas arsenicoxydans]|uniref:DUF4224 domain-containing protein n=1 Tax=Pseudomonas arsenicoxydans TaxID=702115 RepID=A0A502HU34_9PSED|nr:hypothetical protein [Pseudomonas arsenicoxydans]TPG77323.1 hypothetical protein EAH78_14065 [Pseudomonas arsenicoxydans]
MNSRSDNVLVFADLQRITGYQRRSDVERSLIEQGIRMFRGRTGPWTTTDLVNQAGGYTATSQDSYSPEII